MARRSRRCVLRSRAAPKASTSSSRAMRPSNMRRPLPLPLARFAAVAAVAAIIGIAGIASLRGASPRFYKDDPLSREPESADAAHVSRQEVDLLPDLMLNLFTQPGDPEKN